jgi:hypothetical protein
MSIAPTLLDDLLDPLAHCFTPAVAQEVVNLRFDRKVQTKLDDLRHKANEGTLTPDERTDYETLVETIDFIAILQAKSKRMLEEDASS